MRYIGREHGRIDTGEVHGERCQWPFGERRQQRAQAAGSLSVATIGVDAGDDFPLDAELREQSTPAQVELERLVERIPADDGCGLEIVGRVRGQRRVGD